MMSSVIYLWSYFTTQDWSMYTTYKDFSSSLRFLHGLSRTQTNKQELRIRYIVLGLHRINGCCHGFNQHCLDQSWLTFLVVSLRINYEIVFVDIFISWFMLMQVNLGHNCVPPHSQEDLWRTFFFKSNS